MTFLYDPIRQKKVEKTSEEMVRQRLILLMIQELGYPKGLLAVEKELSFFQGPQRRLDLLCFIPSQEGGIKPLLLIECKGEKGDLEPVTEKQVWGYNLWVKAPFVALAFPDRVKTTWKEGEKLCHIPFLPTFQQLSSSISSAS